MKTDPDLWQRLEHMSFDEQGAPLSAARRLARENGWSPAFADRVMAEYRRFAYLAVVAGHEVTPSDEVDQAWHLHLTYTRHYWGDFAKMLGTPLHHGPTRGTGGDKIRYEDNYAATLASYEREFGEQPPADIWPSVHIRFGEAPYYQRVNTRTHIVVKVPGPVRQALTFLQASSRKIAAGLAAIALTGGLSVATARAALQDSGGASLGAIVMIVGVAAMLIGVVAVIQASNKRKADQKGDGSGGGDASSSSSGKTTDGGDSGCGSGCGG